MKSTVCECVNKNMYHVNYKAISGVLIVQFFSIFFIYYCYFHSVEWSLCVYVCHTNENKLTTRNNLTFLTWDTFLTFNNNIIIDYLPSGQLSNTICAISPAESEGLNKNSFVLPLTSMRRKFIWKKEKSNVGVSLIFLSC